MHSYSKLLLLLIIFVFIYILFNSNKIQSEQNNESAPNKEIIIEKEIIEKEIVIEKEIIIEKEIVIEKEKIVEKKLISTWDMVYSVENITELIIETNKRFKARKLVTDLNKLIDPHNFQAIGKQAQAFYELSILLQRAETESILESANANLDALKYHYNEIEKYVYPYLAVNTVRLLESYKGRGIVIGVGPKYVKLAYWLISSIRNIFKSKMPIEIACINNSELNPAQKRMFRDFEDVSFLYISDYLKGESAQPVSWAAKVFGMLFSSFSEVLWLDADIVLLNSPEQLFEDPDYLQSGALYWYDRKTVQSRPSLRQSIEVILNGEVREEIKNSMIYQDPSVSSHLIETGVVLYDKRKHFHSLLLTCRLNCKKERESVGWVLFYGEKESFWLAHEMIHDYSYRINRYPAGVVGFPEEWKNNTGIHGLLAHFDGDGNPLWWNGGLVENKRKNNSKLMEFLAYSFELEGYFWHFERWMKTSTIMELAEKDLLLIKQFLDLWSSLSTIKYFSDVTKFT